MPAATRMGDGQHYILNEIKMVYISLKNILYSLEESVRILGALDDKRTSY